jgi:hypothetical protein
MVLANHQLAYYENEVVAGAGDAVAARLVVSLSSNARVEDCDDEDNPNGFVVVVHSGPGQAGEEELDWEIRCSTAAEKSLWMETIQKSIHMQALAQKKERRSSIRQVQFQGDARYAGQTIKYELPDYEAHQFSVTIPENFRGGTVVFQVPARTLHSLQIRQLGTPARKPSIHSPQRRSSVNRIGPRRRQSSMAFAPAEKKATTEGSFGWNDAFPDDTPAVGTDKFEWGDQPSPSS